MDKNTQKLIDNMLKALNLKGETKEVDVLIILSTIDVVWRTAHAAGYKEALSKLKDKKIFEIEMT